MTEIPTRQEILDMASQSQLEQSIDISELIYQNILSIQAEELFKIMFLGFIVITLFSIIFSDSIISLGHSIISKIKKYIPTIVWVKND